MAQIYDPRIRDFVDVDRIEPVIYGDDGTAYTWTGDAGYVAVPYGQDPVLYANMSAQERLVADMLANARETRDTNRDATLAGFSDVQAGQQAATDLLAARGQAGVDEAVRLRDGALTQDVDSYNRLQGAAGGATQMDFDTLNAMLGIAGGVAGTEEQALGRFTGAANIANRMDMENLDTLYGAAGAARDQEAAMLGGLYDAYGQIDQIDPSEWGADLDSAAGRASADPRAVAAQYGALGQYAQMASAGLTDAERFAMEQARRQEEQDRRNAMQAQLADLNARGFGGSGAEIGAMLGAQSMTSQNRMLQDMAALAQAQERRERALAAGSDLATTLRGQSYGESYQTGSAADAMAQFNRTGSTDYSRWQDEFMRQQEQEAWQNARDFYGEATGAIGREYDRQGDVYGAGRETVDSMYGREGDVYGSTTDSAGRLFDRSTQVADQAYGVAETGYGREQDVFDAGTSLTDQNYQRGLDTLSTYNTLTDALYGAEQDRQGNVVDFTGLFTGQGARDSAAVTDAQQTALGQQETRRAESLLEDDFDITDPSTWA